MKKACVKKIVIEDRIYIRNEDIEDLVYLESLYTYNTGEEFITTIECYDEYVAVPSNSYYKLDWKELEDNRNFDVLDYKIPFSGTLRPEQQDIVNKFFSKGRARSGLIQAKPGFGKTFTAAKIISDNNTKTLVLVHTKLLFRQWIEELEKQLPNTKIGNIGDGLFDVQDVTIAIYKTAHNNIDIIKDSFSMVIVDESHKCPADMFSRVVNGINAKVKIALTATPRRKDGKHVFLDDFFSQFRVQADDSRDLPTPSVQIIKTDFKFNVISPKTDWARTLNKLCSDQAYIKFIAEKAISYIKQGRCPLILGERVQMLKDIQALIPNSICVIGSTSEDVRKDALEHAGTKYSAILSTKLFDEGISCHRLDTLVLTCPSNNSVQWEQRIGRIERLHPDKKHPLVADIWLSGNIVNRQQVNRLNWYQQRGYYIL